MIDGHTSTHTAGAATVPKRTLEMLNGSSMTYTAALDTDKNIIREAEYVAATKAQDQELWKEKNTMAALVKHHLGLGDRDTCIIAGLDQWIRGSFNVCIPIEVRSSASASRRLILRCAMPHKLAEAEYPGSVDEKMGCEVGTYGWMQEYCPEIRIPHLYGFGFSDRRHFTHEAQRPIHVRALRMLRRLIYGLVGYPALLCRYTRNPTIHHLSTAYMLLEHVGSKNSQMLSNTWEQYRTDTPQRQRLFRGMARLMLSLARIPQPHIGSFQFHDDCSITLTNRPLISSIMILENDGTPRTIQRSYTYPSTEPFISDLFNFHDRRLLSHPNAIYDRQNCYGEMAAKVLLRALAHHYVRQDQRNGPFFLQLDDFHASNIFVDDDWNMTCLIDLEWVSALPVEKMAVPYWLTGCAIDEIRGERLVEFDTARKEFMDIFEEEERKVTAEHRLSLSQIMRETWNSGGTWFWYSLTSINAMYLLSYDHILPKFSPLSITEEEVLQELLSRFWSHDAADVVQRKVADLEKYEAELEHLFRDCNDTQ